MAATPAVPDMRLELVPIPVSDVDRAKEFYQQAGFGNLHDTQVTEAMRVVQLTPPGSSCAIVFGTGMGLLPKWSLGRSKASILSSTTWSQPAPRCPSVASNSAMSTTWAGSFTRISVTRTATCGRFSNGPPVTGDN